MRRAPSIDSYGGGGFRVSGQWRPGSLLVLDDLPTDWRPATMDDLTPEDFDSVIAAGAAVSEFVLLGTGARQLRPTAAVRQKLQSAGFGLEFMSTEAAARLYGVLTSEGRRIATALLAV